VCSDDLYKISLEAEISCSVNKQFICLFRTTNLWITMKPSSINYLEYLYIFKKIEILSLSFKIIKFLIKQKNNF